MTRLDGINQMLCSRSLTAVGLMMIIGLRHITVHLKHRHNIAGRYYFVLLLFIFIEARFQANKYFWHGNPAKNRYHTLHCHMQDVFIF